MRDKRLHSSTDAVMWPDAAEPTDNSLAFPRSLVDRHFMFTLIDVQVIQA